MSASQVARLGRRWTALGAGLSGGAVTGLATDGPWVYAAGGFTTIEPTASVGGAYVNGFAVFGGVNWRVPAQQLRAGAQTVAKTPEGILVGGSFSGGSGISSRGLALWQH